MLRNLNATESKIDIKTHLERLTETQKLLVVVRTWRWHIIEMTVVKSVQEPIDLIL